MRSGKFSLKMCSKSGKLSAEKGIQCGKLNLKMFPVNDRLWMGKWDRLSLSVVTNYYIFSG